MIGVNQITGKHLDGMEHLRQSITDILRTPIGTRVMRRDYGSKIPDLIDAPMTQENVIEIYAEIGKALARWEPRVRLTNVRIVNNDDAGRTELELTGNYIVNGRTITLQGIVL